MGVTRVFGLSSLQWIKMTKKFSSSIENEKIKMVNKPCTLFSQLKGLGSKTLQFNENVFILQLAKITPFHERLVLTVLFNDIALESYGSRDTFFVINYGISKKILVENSFKIYSKM